MEETLGARLLLVAAAAMVAAAAAAAAPPAVPGISPPAVPGFAPPVPDVFYGGGDLGPVLQVADVAACGAACVGLGSACIGFNACANGSLVRCGPQTWSRTLAPVANAGCAAYVRERPRNDSRVAQVVPWRLAAPAAGSVRIPAGAAGGLLRSMFDTNVVYLLQYDVDEMLFPFRQRAGLPQPPGAQCFGWDCPENWIEGESEFLTPPLTRADRPSSPAVLRHPNASDLTQRPLSFSWAPATTCAGRSTRSCAP